MVKKMERPGMILFDYGETLIHEAAIDLLRGERAVFQYVAENPRHITPEEAAARESLEEFNIRPTELIPIGCGPKEPDTGLSPVLFLCTEYEGTPHCTSDEMSDARFLTLNELLMIRDRLFEPFADSIAVLERCETLTLAPPQKADDLGEEIDKQKFPHGR